MDRPKNDFRDYSNDSFMHYGVMGMKWGHHKHPYQEEAQNRYDLAQAKYRHQRRMNKALYKAGKIDKKTKNKNQRSYKDAFAKETNDLYNLKIDRKNLSLAQQEKYRDASRRNLYKAIGKSGTEKLLKYRPRTAEVGGGVHRRTSALGTIVPSVLGGTYGGFVGGNLHGMPGYGALAGAGYGAISGITRAALDRQQLAALDMYKPTTKKSKKS